MKYKYRLAEQEEETPVGSGTSQERVAYDLVLTPLSGTVTDAIDALEKIDNYGTYVSNLRNTRADIEKAVTNHFGPSEPRVKQSVETAFKLSGGNSESFKDNLIKSRQNRFLDSSEEMFTTLTNNKGKFYPKTSKATIDDYIKSIATKPKLLKWKLVGDTLVFPSASNPTKKMTEKIIDTVMRSAKIQYGLESKEPINENTSFNLNPETAFQIYNILTSEYDIIRNDFPTKSSFFFYLNDKIK